MMIKFDDFRNNSKKKNLERYFYGISNELKEFDLYVDIVLKMYMFCVKTL